MKKVSYRVVEGIAAVMKKARKKMDFSIGGIN